MKKFEKWKFPDNSELFVCGDNVAELTGTIDGKVSVDTDMVVKGIKEAVEKTGSEGITWTTNA